MTLASPPCFIWGRAVGWSVLAGVFVGLLTATALIAQITLSQSNFVPLSFLWSAWYLGPYGFVLGLTTGATMGLAVGVLSRPIAAIPSRPARVLVYASALAFGTVALFAAFASLGMAWTVVPTGIVSVLITLGVGAAIGNFAVFASPAPSARIARR